MKASDIKQIVKEEIKLQRKRLLSEGIAPEQAQQQSPAPQQQSPAPQQPTTGLNPNKAKGIITGAVKTLVNSGALQGVDGSKVDQITSDLLSYLTKSAPTYIAAAPEERPEDEVADGSLEDDHMYDSENEELSDQSQYDPSLEKIASDAEEVDDDESDEMESSDEPLFESKDFKALLK